ncbi:type II secretion system GspH family protein [bacterium]|nr:type II secretion system GspH family protein [bacterium]
MRQYQSRLGLQGVYPTSTRRGFTLIELLIVMVIILLLSGMLLGAVILVRRQVVRAQQVAELTQIDLALTNFKMKYGIYPPSRIRLRNYRAGTTPVGNSYALDNAFDAHSVAYLRRIWPSIKLPIRARTADTTLTVEQPTSAFFWYLDSAAGPDPNAQYDLEGDQCLVFFLGGIAERRGANEYILHGFTDDQTNPSRVADSSTPQTMTRVQSLYNFDVGRLYLRIDYPELIDTGARNCEQSYTSGSVPVTDFYPNGFIPGDRSQNLLGRLPSYKVIGADSSKPLPIAYFSAYEGRGYRPDDLNIPEPISAGPGTDEIYFQLVWPVVTQATNDTTNPASHQSLEPNPYSRNAASLGPVPPNTVALRAAGSVIQCYNPKTYQIILPGPDNQYGAGGSQLDYQGSGWNENADNIANFAGGTPVGEFVTQQQK